MKTVLLVCVPDFVVMCGANPPVGRTTSCSAPVPGSKHLFAPQVETAGVPGEVGCCVAEAGVRHLAKLLELSGGDVGRLLGLPADHRGPDRADGRVGERREDHCGDRERHDRLDEAEAVVAAHPGQPGQEGGRHLTCVGA